MILDTDSHWNDIKNYAGGKGLSLFRLQQQGFVVPRFYCISSQFYEKLVYPLLSDISDLNAIREKIHNLTIPKLPQINSRTVSVRSSANLEDGSKHSFAGIYESFLFVEDDIQSFVKRCWMSVFTPEHIKYLKENDISIKAIKMAVIVQEMIQPEISGVIFQANPNGNINEQILVAGFGVGQGVVEGLVETDTFTLNRLSQKIDSKIARKTKRILDRYGQLRPVPESLQDKPILGESEVNQIFKSASQYRDGQNTFFDFEFAFAKNQLYFLQARPITTVSQNPEISLYDNSNIVENYPGVSLPLTTSNLNRLYGVNLETLMLAIGYPQSFVKQMKPVLYHATAEFRGRVYYHVNAWYTILSTLPFLGNFFTSSWDLMIGVQGTKILSQKKTSGLGSFFHLIKIIRIIFSYFFFPKYQSTKYQNQYIQFKQWVNSHDIEGMSYDELVKYYQKAESHYFKLGSKALLNDLIVSLHMKMTLWCINYNYELLTRYTKEDKSLESYQLVLSTNSLIHYLQENPKALTELATTLETHDKTFNQMLDKHLESYGDRTIEEMKFETPSLREQPADFIRFLVNATQSKQTFESESRAAFPGRNPLKYCLFRVFMIWYRKSLAFRELSRFNRVRVKNNLRQIFLRMGHHLQAKNLIEQKEDIFYFFESEIQKSLDSIPNSKELISNRKQLYRQYQQERMPQRFLLNDEFDLSQFELKQKNAGNLNGLGCCPGVIVGECLVLERPRLDLNLKGKILVTRTTDPGWVFLMMQASGIIVEQGNILSHAAIIGRELNIPTIINIAGITEQLKTGEQVEMNGATGEIKRL